MARLRLVARDVAWVARDNVHLTLKFLGAVEAPRLEALAEGVRSAAALCDPFELGVQGLGAFPSPARPRVVWAGVHEGAGPAGRLVGRIDDALAPLGFPREARAFAAHVTLGRVRQPRANPALAAALSPGQPFGRQRVERVALVRSELSPRGARYSELAAAPLASGSTR